MERNSLHLNVRFSSAAKRVGASKLLPHQPGSGVIVRSVSNLAVSSREAARSSPGVSATSEKSTIAQVIEQEGLLRPKRQIWHGTNDYPTIRNKFPVRERAEVAGVYPRSRMASGQKRRLGAP